MRKRWEEEKGFTLMEVLVALGIAAGALLLVLSANNASLKRSASSREDLRIVRAIESKYEECVLGVESGLSGEFEGLRGWRWELFRTTTHLAELKKLKRIQFVAYRPDGRKACEWEGLHAAE